MITHPALIQIDYLESEIPAEATLREYGRNLARERRHASHRGVSARFRALALSHVRGRVQL